MKIKFNFLELQVHRQALSYKLLLVNRIKFLSRKTSKVILFTPSLILQAEMIFNCQF